MRSVRVIGSGRAGGAMAAALAASGWQVRETLGRGASAAEVEAAAREVGLLLIATPDSAIAQVAKAVAPDSQAVVAHMSGALGLDAVAPHRRRAAIHPLTSMPDPALGARRLRSGCWFAVAGDPISLTVVSDLGGQAFEVSERARALYHAAAAIASNHLVALLGQAERVCEKADAPFEAMLSLVRATLDNVAELGPADALTGPAARGDEATIQRHLEALPPDERACYEALAEQARRLAGRVRP